MSAASDWSAALDQWAIPPAILEAAPESPYGHQVAMFARRAELLRTALTPSRRAALDALPKGGSVLDVGCGAGAASLPLTGTAGEVTGVDPSPEMLDEFAARMTAAGIAHATIAGNWNSVADQAPVADVVVCHHVAYNVPDLRNHVLELTAHARVRVVLELTDVHPLTWLNPLWLAFHGCERPTRPTADDAVAVLEESGMTPHRDQWNSDAYERESLAFNDVTEMATWVRRRLCLGPSRDREVAVALEGLVSASGNGRVGLPPRRIVSLWWDGLG